MPDEIIRIEDHYYILATSSRADERPRVIKQGESFAVFGSAGSIRPVGLGEQGIYHEGTRFLSQLELELDGRPLQPLRSTVRADHVLVVELTNPDYRDLPETVPRDALHVAFTSFLWSGAWYARVVVHNFTLRAIELDATLRFAADWADVFEIRGMKRARRGTPREATIAKDHVVLSYEGLDRVVRATRIAFSPEPRALDSGSATCRLRLPPHGEHAFEVTASFVTEGEPARDAARPTSFDGARARVRAPNGHADEKVAIVAANPRIDEWLERSACDLRMMLTDCKEGPYPYAGVPWYSTVFGRDGLITALEVLWLDPSVARGVLGHLAATQATSADPSRDAEPGKIIHEERRGEMAALGEIPFARYYGTVDATPLFVVLAGRYYRRTADRAFIESLWPHVERALAWIDEDGDADRDGFLEYARRSRTGLVSHGWKDSSDAIMHRDGTLAEGPIALCEVQGYAYAARRAAALLARALGDLARADRLDERADEMRAAFDRAFWSDALDTYVLALDGDKRPCDVRASNAGHTLFSGIATPERASRLAATLMGPHMFSGWGIRTLDDREARYNPMSYHNGSVWPHDNAIAALGLARYGHKEHALTLFEAMYRASVHFDLHRMPELFCGFPRSEHDGPTPYPVACSPQAWAAGASFMLLQACLGLDIDAPARRLRFLRPTLPDNLPRICVRNLRVGDASADVTIHRDGPHVGVQIDRCDGDLEILVVKRDPLRRE